MKRRLETGMVRHKALVCPQEDITTEECSACAVFRLKEKEGNARLSR